MAEIEEVMSKKKRNVVIIDQPMYCSALSDKCTAIASLIRGRYEPFIYNSERGIKAPLVVSSNSDVYERTFPKFE